MIQKLEIKNFRCFVDFEASGFERVNLIGGKNNSGKTCLLEAIGCLAGSSQISDIAKLRQQKLHELVSTNSFGNDVKIIASLTDQLISSLIENKAKFKEGNLINEFNHKLTINLFTQKTEIPPVYIVKSFDEFDQRLLKEPLIQIAQIVDDRIDDIRTFNSKEGLWIKTLNNEYEPIDNFGDAIKNLIRYFTPIFEKELLDSREKTFSILLIDEIENGIHYSVHEEFWAKIFKLTQKLNVQIFATTHSREMISSFNTIALNHGGGAYFEMSRDIDSGEIFAQKHDMHLLQYELEAPKSTFRGE